MYWKSPRDAAFLRSLFPLLIKFFHFLVTSLANEVMFLVALVCLFVCLSVDNITQKVMNGLG